jgi:hypothetical protein
MCIWKRKNSVSETSWPLSSIKESRIMDNVKIRSLKAVVNSAAFTATKVDKIFSGYRPCQLVNNYQRFRDHLSPSPGSDVPSDTADSPRIFDHLKIVSYHRQIILNLVLKLILSLLLSTPRCLFLLWSHFMTNVKINILIINNLSANIQTQM